MVSGGRRRGRLGVGADVDVAGTVPLTAALVDRVAEGELVCLDAGEVVPFLRERLGWKVAVVSLRAVRLRVLCRLLRILES